MSAVIYARQSLDRDGEGTAVARQLTECHELAKRHKLTITREFIDNDVSASKGIRPAFTELLREIRAGHIDTIVVWHTDRLYRRLGDLVDQFARLEQDAERRAHRHHHGRRDGDREQDLDQREATLTRAVQA